MGRQRRPLQVLKHRNDRVSQGSARARGPIGEANETHDVSWVLQKM